MTQMRHQSADAKRARRNRYKDACRPVQELFACTSKQVAGQVRGLLQHSRDLAERNVRLEAEVARLGRGVSDGAHTIARLEGELRALKAELEHLPEAGSPTVV